MAVNVEYDAYKDDIGVEIVLDVGTDISSATVRKIKFRRPNRTFGVWDASEKSSTSIAYVTQDGDLNDAGIWILQAYVEKATWKLHGKEQGFGVGGSIPIE